MRAEEFPFEVGAEIRVEHWMISGVEYEDGVITGIPDGENLDEVEVEYADGSYGAESPEAISERVAD